MRVMLWILGFEVVDFRIGEWPDGKPGPEELEFGFVGSETAKVDGLPNSERNEDSE